MFISSESQKKKRKNMGLKSLFGEIIVEFFSKLAENLNLQNQEAE